MELTKEQHAFFQAFGYLALSTAAFGDIVEELQAEGERALDTAFGARETGTVFVPVMADSTPCSMRLLHDDRLLRPTRQLLGTEPVLKPAKMARFADATPWHRDCHGDLPGLKAVCYLGPVDAGPIPFDIVPASHRDPAGRFIEDLLGRATPLDGPSGDQLRQTGVPIYRLQVQPGQFLIFDIHVWHANHSRDRRLQWSVTFLATPRDEGSVDEVAQYVGDFLTRQHSYPADRFPYLPPAWERGEDSSPLLATLQRTGVLSAYLQHFGAGR
jgi:ectoine hydroxylase-related dioxygenase (phytanoyl-CoA dioxygenase family)